MLTLDKFKINDTKNNEVGICQAQLEYYPTIPLQLDTHFSYLESLILGTDGSQEIGKKTLRAAT